MSSKQEKIAKLFEEGHSPFAIASKLSLSVATVHKILREMGVSEQPPPGYIPVREAAKRFKVSVYEIVWGIWYGELKSVVRIGHRVYVLPEAVEVWIRDEPARNRRKWLERQAKSVASNAKRGQ